MLNEEQKREALLIASVGCDRGATAKYVGVDLDELVRTAASDDEFARELARAEAGAELAHMRNVQQAARDQKHWRASVWWLERRAPERYARRGANAIERRELSSFLESVAEAVASAVQQEDDRRRVLERIGELAERLSKGSKEIAPADELSSDTDEDE